MSEQDRAKLNACLVLLVEVTTLQTELKERQAKVLELLCDVVLNDRASNTPPKPHLTLVQ